MPPPMDTDVAIIFGNRTWAQHNALRGPRWKDLRTRGCMCTVEGCTEQWIECWGPKNAPYLKRVGDDKESARCGMTPEHAGAQACVQGWLHRGLIRIRLASIAASPASPGAIRIRRGGLPLVSCAGQGPTNRPTVRRRVACRVLLESTRTRRAKMYAFNAASASTTRIQGK